MWVIDVMIDCTAAAETRHCDDDNVSDWCDDRLREMPADDLCLPGQALRCHLAGITVAAAAETRLSQRDVIQAMCPLFAGKALLAVVKV